MSGKPKKVIELEEEMRERTRRKKGKMRIEKNVSYNVSQEQHLSTKLFIEIEKMRDTWGRGMGVAGDRRNGDLQYSPPGQWISQSLGFQILIIHLMFLSLCVQHHQPTPQVSSSWFFYSTVICFASPVVSVFVFLFLK